MLSGPESLALGELLLEITGGEFTGALLFCVESADIVLSVSGIILRVVSLRTNNKLSAIFNRC